MDTIKGPGSNMTPNKIEEAQPTFFFERHDGSIIAVSESEAWSIMSGRVSAVGPVKPQPKLIGASDGRKYQTAVAESHQMLHSGKTREEIQAHLRAAYEAELETARTNKIMPRNFDTLDKYGRPTNISTL